MTTLANNILSIKRQIIEACPDPSTYAEYVAHMDYEALAERYGVTVAQARSLAARALRIIYIV